MVKSLGADHDLHPRSLTWSTIGVTDLILLCTRRCRR